MRNERSNACCGPWPDKSWIWISSPFAGAAGTIFLIGCPVQYANTTLFGRARSTHFHITFLVGRSWIGLCGGSWTRCECPSSDAATKLPCSQGQSDRWADAVAGVAFVMILAYPWAPCWNETKLRRSELQSKYGGICAKAQRLGFENMINSLCQSR